MTNRSVYGALLYLFPKRFRRQYRSRMLQAFRDLERQHRRSGSRASLWIHLLKDLAVTLPAAWIARFRAQSHLHSIASRRGIAAAPRHRTRESLMSNIEFDVRNAVRTLRMSPAYTTIATLTLALGIGLTTAVFSVVDGVLFRPLPLAHPERLVRIYENNMEYDWRRANVAPGNFHDWHERAQSFEGMSVFRGRSVNLTGTGEPERVGGMLVTEDVDVVLGAAPVAGRWFVRDEFSDGAPRTVMITEGLWERRYARDPALIGRTITINQEAATVIGVVPGGILESFNGWEPGILVPFSVSPDDTRRSRYLNAIARLEPGVSLARAKEEMSHIAAQLEREHPRANGGFGAEVHMLGKEVVGDVHTPLLLFFAAGGLVLLIAATNVAALTLARGASRQQELGVRAALGANRWRLIRQLLLENLVLALGGGALGFLVARLSTKTFLRFAPDGIPRITEVTVDLRILGFTLAVSVATALLFGMLPALHVARSDPAQSLRSSRRIASERRRQRLLSGLVSLEVAVALTLLIGAGLLIRSFQARMNIDPGLNASNVLTLKMIPRFNYATVQEQAAFVTEVLDRVSALPGVHSVAEINLPPFTDHDAQEFFGIEGRDDTAEDNPQVAHIRAISPGYFSTMGIPLLHGREFTRADAAEPRVAVINEAMARQFWGNESPIGMRISRGGSDDADAVLLEIVGVARNVRHHGVDKPPPPEFYIPHTLDDYSTRALMIRTDVEPTSVLDAVRQEIWAVNKDQSIFDVGTMESWISESMARPRFSTWLAGLFGGSAALLAAIGLYGVISHAVTQRIHELGVRIAIGAPRAAVLQLVLQRGLVLTAVGIAIGLGASLASSRMLSSMLFGVSATDPATFVLTPLLILLVALTAAYVPARRATHVDPLQVLQRE